MVRKYDLKKGHLKTYRVEGKNRAKIVSAPCLSETLCCKREPEQPYLDQESLLLCSSKAIGRCLRIFQAEIHPMDIF